jgi:hypothetical protein
MPVTRHQQPIDKRPFRSKADQAREETLEAKYREVAIPDVVAALQQQAGDHPVDDGQMH